MEPQMYADLVKAIRDWSNKHSYEINFYWGQDTVKHMADAARAVVDASEECQKYAKEEGYLKVA